MGSEVNGVEIGGVKVGVRGWRKLRSKGVGIGGDGAVGGWGRMRVGTVWGLEPEVLGRRGWVGD